MQQDIERNPAPSRHGPLTALRVLEFGQIAAGPFAASLLADLGADVVKVERPDGGDGMRGWPPLSGDQPDAAFSENFASINRNKRSIAVDLKNPHEAARLRRLCAKADIVLENYRPGVLDRLGFGYETLRAENPGLIYCSVSGYGQTGPYAEKGAFDVTVQAMSGVMSVTGEEGGAPVKCGVPIGDFCAGLYAAYAILAAVVERRETGQGAQIDCSMLGSLLGVSALQTSEYFGTGQSPKPLGSAHPRNAPYQAFRAADKHFAIAAGNDKLWAEVCHALAVPHLVDDPRFRTQALRAGNQKELLAILQPLFERRPAEYWLAEMDRRGVPCAPINDYPAILSDPHVEAMGLVMGLRLPNGIETRTTGFPVSISNHRFSIFREPPQLGADNPDVFREWLSGG